MINTALFPHPVRVSVVPAGAPQAPGAPAPAALSTREQEALERQKLLRAIALPSTACAAIGGSAGAAMGYHGGIMGAVAGVAISGAGAVAGAALGGFIGLEVGSRLFGKYDLLGVLGVILTTSAGVVAGGYAGFYGGAALGAAAASGGGTVGAAVGALGLGSLAATFGAIGVAVHEVTTKGDRYPILHEQWTQKS